MADPLSVSVSVLAAIQSTKSLYETVKRFQNRDKTLRRLQDELEDLVNILNTLKQVINTDTSMPALLQGPVDRCSQVCREFEHSMNAFGGKAKTTFRDWARMEFMKGDINEFMDTLAGYKSTIAVGLGTVTMRTARLSHQVLEEYDEMIKDTAYNLEVRLQRIDDKMTSLTTDNSSSSDTHIDLKDERTVTKQCLRICEDARSYIESLTGRDPSLLQEGPSGDATNYVRDKFEAQLLTRQALDENRDRFVEIIGRLRERLEAMVLDGDPNERLRLQEDINTSKQCLEVCRLASSEVSHQKIHTVGEVIAEGDSDQVVVTTLADLFDVRKAMSKDRSAQLIGSMSDETLQQLSENRYSSRFGAPASDFNSAQAGTTVLASVFETPKVNPSLSQETGKGRQSPSQEARRNWPCSNETRKRVDTNADPRQKSRHE